MTIEDFFTDEEIKNLIVAFLAGSGAASQEEVSEFLCQCLAISLLSVAMSEAASGSRRLKMFMAEGELLVEAWL